MASKAIANSTLVLRIFALLFLAASIVLMATNTVKFDDGSQASWKDIIAYRYVIATAMVGFVYTALQIPFAIYYVCTEKRLTRNDCLPEFDFYGDKIMSFLLATGVGAGFAISFEFKRLLNGFANTSLLDRGNLATGILLGGFVCMALLSILSSIGRNHTSNKGFFR
ncbi:CASP-like protein [Actinidia chinensis var. chinensis]|uniref:CASP-like protein n=1 Tax=Actinidia chinensis var. chinensis TaxID=1590841 RepID=A0A2R6RC67_ACTCC|nr:CASP-like protein [Actinidia chinensis var. chinensis]